MADWPDASNFFAALYTSLSRRRVAELFATRGWEVREPDDWDYFEVICPCAELVIEGESPILLHGLVVDVEIESVVATIEQTGIAFTAEHYNSTGGLQHEWMRGVT